MTGGCAVVDVLPRGTRIAGFVLEEPLGRGGFGITYRAHSVQGGRVYAIKEYFPADFARRDIQGHVVAAENAEAARLFELGRRAFLDEAYILRDLPRQPGLVRVRSAFEKHNTAYCVTDFIDGDTLDKVSARILDARGWMPESHLLRLISTLCRALGAVHAAGFIHRDIKPANVMIERSGGPVLIDFGAARAHRGSQAMTSMLSRRYAALEQFPSSRRLGLREGPWTDLYALSVMLYELMARSQPPDSEIRFAEVQARRPDPYLPVTEALARNRVAADYSAALLGLVDAGCRLMPSDRPASTDEFRRAIAGLITENPVGSASRARDDQDAAMPQPASRKAARMNSDGRKSMMMLALIVGLAVAAALIGLSG